uniref:Uncharacterized protein n=1 Tax=Ditylenchus dipsaci TaxID=166011 RepID=A0A915CPC6_9BILA
MPPSNLKDVVMRNIDDACLHKYLSTFNFYKHLDAETINSLSSTAYVQAQIWVGNYEAAFFACCEAAGPIEQLILKILFNNNQNTLSQNIYNALEEGPDPFIGYWPKTNQRLLTFLKALHNMNNPIQALFEVDQYYQLKTDLVQDNFTLQYFKEKLHAKETLLYTFQWKRFSLILFGNMKAAKKALQTGVKTVIVLLEEESNKMFDLVEEIKKLCLTDSTRMPLSDFKTYLSHFKLQFYGRNTDLINLVCIKHTAQHLKADPSPIADIMDVLRPAAVRKSRRFRKT